MGSRSPEPLGDFVRRIRNKKGLSLQGVSTQSGYYGPPITASYISRIENNPRRRPSADRLRVLAHGLGIPAQELLERAAGLVDSGNKSDELQLLSRFRELSPEKKADVLVIVDALHARESARKTPRPRSA